MTFHVHEREEIGLPVIQPEVPKPRVVEYENEVPKITEEKTTVVDFHEQEEIVHMPVIQLRRKARRVAEKAALKVSRGQGFDKATARAHAKVAVKEIHDEDCARSCS